MVTIVICIIRTCVLRNERLFSGSSDSLNRARPFPFEIRHIHAHADTHTQCTFRLIVSLLLSLPLPSPSSSPSSLLIFRLKRHRHTKNYAFNMLWYTRFSGMSTTYAKKKYSKLKAKNYAINVHSRCLHIHAHINWISFVEWKENMYYEKQLSENMSGISWKTKKKS